MDVAFVTKIICDLCLWFSASGLLLSLFGSVGSGYGSAAVMVAGSALSAFLRHKKPSLSFLPLLALVFCAYWIRSFLDCLLIIPPCLYCIWVCLFRAYPPDHYQCRKYITAVAPIALLVIILIAIFGDSDILRSIVMPYYIIFLFSGVLTLRILRNEDTKRKDWRFWLLIVMSLTVCCAAALFFSSEWFFQFAGAVLGFVYNNVVAPIIAGLVYVFAGIMWLLSGLFNIDKLKEQLSDKEVPKLTDSLNVDLGAVSEKAGNSELGRKVAIALAIIAFVILAIIIFRRLAGQESGSEKMEPGVRDVRKQIDGRKDREASLPKFFARDTRQAVRRFYRKFLSKAQSAGLDIRPFDTSDSIMKSAEALYDAELLSRLREMYIVARYSTREITKSEVKLVKTICSDLKPKTS
jgi:hypothetical protein